MRVSKYLIISKIIKIYANLNFLIADVYILLFFQENYRYLYSKYLPECRR